MFTFLTKYVLHFLSIYVAHFVLKIIMPYLKLLIPNKKNRFYLNKHSCYFVYPYINYHFPSYIRLPVIWLTETSLRIKPIQSLITVDLHGNVCA